MLPTLLIFLSPAVTVFVFVLLITVFVPFLLRSPSLRTPATHRGCVVDDSLLADASRLTGVGL